MRQEVSKILNGETLLDSYIHIKSPENRFAAKYILYNQIDEELSASLTAATRLTSDVSSSVSVRVRRTDEMTNYLSIMYRGQGDLDSSIQAASKIDLEGMLSVRPHNRAHGKYELLEAPRVVMKLEPIADATTRSQPHLQTLNFGDTQRMMIGRDEIEQFESFVSFGDLDARIPDLLYLEEAKLKLYYTGSLAPDARIELHQPNTLWLEYGITYANRPHSTQLLSSSYILNTTERCVEFDMMELLKMWREHSVPNMGLIIQSSDATLIYFNTRESSKPPILQIKYITSQIYSIGRTEIESDVFIYGTGRTEVASTLTVHSDIGLEWLTSELYVHRYQDHVHHDLPEVISVSHPNLDVDLIVAKRLNAELMVTISVAENMVKEKESWVAVSNPELNSEIITAIRTVADKESLVAVRVSRNEEKEMGITVSHPEISSVITVDRQMTLASELTISQLYEEVWISNLAVSTPDINSEINVRASANAGIASIIEVPNFEEQPGKLSVSKPDVVSSIEVKYVDVLDGHIIVKEREYLECTLYVYEWKDIQSTVDVRQIFDMENEITVSKPDLAGYIHPRVIANEELSSITSIRKRDASDLTSTVVVKGPGNQAYFYIL
ncbi:hypothetical protein CS562_07460 [Paenibacillus sp. LK1]|nr:hypothetical protein CS562_07460 [Paenibacillus sp. LK1]